jgi:c-di-GMP-related signal transduction protein
MWTHCSKVLFARQPIVDQRHDIVAYELLYRSSDDRDTAFFMDDSVATATVVNAAFRRIGIEAVVGRAKALINVNAEFLLSHRVEQLPRHCVMLEILETVDIDDQLVQRCRALKEKGYQLALDDVCRYSDKFEPLLEFIDVVKVDIEQLDYASLARLVEQLRRWPVRVLAEKVETVRSRQQCLQLGMEWFQGFLYGEPAILSI